MSVPSYPRSRRSKSSKPTSKPTPKPTPKPKQGNSSAHLKTKQNVRSSSCNHDSSSSSLDCPSQSQKALNSTEVCNIPPLHEQHKTPQAPTKKKKSVSFHEIVMVRPVLHITEYTDQEVRALWMVEEDRKRIKADILNTFVMVKRVREGKFRGCTRGLEHLSDGGRHRERRNISIREVLEEQERQRKIHKDNNKTNNNDGIVYDTARFQKVYKPHSRAARYQAHAIGKIDEQVAACQNLEDLDASQKVVFQAQ